MKAKLKKIIPFLPLLIFSVTVGYGILHLDVSDASGGEAYGWFYFLFGLLPVSIGYVLSIVLNLMIAVQFLKKISDYSKQLQFLVTVYGVAILQLVFFVFKDAFSILWPLWTLEEPGVIGFVITAILIGVFGSYTAAKLEKVESGEKTEKISPFPIAVGILLPIVAGAATAGWKAYHDQSVSGNRRQEYQECIAQTLSDQWGIGGSVKLVLDEINEGEKETYVVYTVTQSEMTVYARARLSLSEENEWVMTESSLTDYEDSLQVILPKTANSEEGAAILKQFVEEVNLSIRENQLTEILDAEYVMDWETDDYKPVTFKLLEHKATNDIRKLAEKNHQSSEPDISVFGGYSALTIQELMSKQTVAVSLTLGFTDRAQDDALNKALDHYEDLIKGIDFSSLPSGVYLISLSGQEKLIEVTDHRISAVTDWESEDSMKNSLLQTRTAYQEMKATGL